MTRLSREPLAAFAFALAGRYVGAAKRAASSYVPERLARVFLWCGAIGDASFGTAATRPWLLLSLYPVNASKQRQRLLDGLLARCEVFNRLSAPAADVV